MHSCFLKCAYLVTPCTICFLLSVFVLTCVLEDIIFSCLIIVLHCIKDPLLVVHYLNLFNLFNCIALLTSYAMSLFSCAFVASIITYLLTYLRLMQPWNTQQATSTRLSTSTGNESILPLVNCFVYYTVLDARSQPTANSWIAEW